MIKARGTLFLDGDFSREHPKPEAVAFQSGDVWTVVKRGPSYSNTYEVQEYDAAGLAWLEQHRSPAAPGSEGANHG
jgi:hypothetical protein